MKREREWAEKCQRAALIAYLPRWFRRTAIVYTPINRTSPPVGSKPSAIRSAISSPNGIGRGAKCGGVKVCLWFVRYTMERPRFSDHLEAIKFICKDFWFEVFKKQIDNLRTNHRGTFVLQDNRFRWLARMSADRSMENGGLPEDSSALAENKAAQAMSLYLYFPCGIIQGALSNLGISCAVSADISNIPACSFVVRIKA